jgi:hypothetical protein
MSLLHVRFLQFYMIILYFNSTHAHLQQNFLYLYSFVYSLPVDGLVEAETCKREIINDK